MSKESRLRLIDLNFLDQLIVDYENIGDYEGARCTEYLKALLSSPEKTKKLLSEVWDKGGKFTEHEWHMQEFHGTNCKCIAPQDKDLYINSLIKK